MTYPFRTEAKQIKPLETGGFNCLLLRKDNKSSQNITTFDSLLSGANTN